MISLLKSWKQYQVSYALKREKITVFEDSLVFPNQYGNLIDPQALT